ncbi:MAG TPA: histidine kinase, partial [Rubrivivax sp.]|nr:histidine kinase [Rubrivivax sp.]
ADARVHLVEWEQRRCDGASFPAEVSARAAGEGRFVAVLRDISERRAAERALVAYQMDLSELARRLLTQERETTRHVAQTLHDQLGQSLATARLRLDAATARMGAAMPEALREECERVGAALERAIADVRVVLGELRPPMLGEQGFVAALDNEIRSRVQDAASVDVLLEVEEGQFALRWPGEVEYAAFMVAREAIVNAQLHAGATLVRVIVEGDASLLRLEVVDDGRGMPDLLRGERAGHLGIVGMRERAMAIGAHFAIEQPAGGGTRVVLCWTRSAAEGA